MTRALIVIDVQLDFCPGGALAVTDGHVIVPGINALMDQFACVVLTQDWHPSHHSSFASEHPGAAAYDLIRCPMGRRCCGRTIASRGRLVQPFTRICGWIRRRW